MNKLGLVLGLLLLTISAALGQIIQFSGAPVGTGGSGQPPTVTASVFNIPAPTSNLQPVGQITASNSPTLYTIISCAGCDNYFQFLNTNQPDLSITVTGAANIMGAATPQVFSPIIQASNPAGPSANATITVNAYLDPIVNSIALGIHSPVIAGNIGTLTAQNGGITNWTKGTCAPNCATFFGLNKAGVFSLTAAGTGAPVGRTAVSSNMSFKPRNGFYSPFANYLSAPFPSPVNSTISTLSNLESVPSSMRIIVQNNSTTADFTIDNSAIAPTSQSGVAADDAYNPYNSSGVQDNSLWIPVTWNGSTSILVPKTINAGRPTVIYSDWMPISGLARRDGKIGSLVLVRRFSAGTQIVQTGGTLSNATTTIDRAFSSQSQTGNVAQAPWGWTGSAIQAKTAEPGIQYVSAQGGITVLGIGDSIMRGQVSDPKLANWGYTGYGTIAAAQLSTPAIPVSYFAQATSGAMVNDFISAGTADVNNLSPQIAIIMAWSYNNRTQGIAAAQGWFDQAVALGNLVKSKGGVPIYATAVPALCADPADEPVRVFSNNLVLGLRNQGELVVDVDSIIGTGSNPNCYNVAAGYAYPVGVHPSYLGYATVAAALKPMIQSVIPQAGTGVVPGVSYIQNVTATNAAGHTGSGTVTVTVSPSIPSNVEAKVFNIPTPALVGDSVGQATADPTGTFAIASCAGCTGFFNITPDTGDITLAQLGANAYNGLVDKLTFQPIVTADDGSGVRGSATQTVVGWADGFKNAPACTIQHPTLISGNTDYLPTATPPWNVAGIDYCVGWANAPVSTILAGNSSQQATSATVSRNGTRLTDTSATLTLVGGIFSRAATFRVQTSSIGVISSIVLTDAGAYTSIPPNPVDTTGWPATTLTPQLNVAWSGAAGNSPAGCTKNDTAFTVTCSTAGTVISGWNFGSYVFVCTADGITLTNSSLTVSGHGVPVQTTNGCTNFTLTNNVLQGGTNTTPIVSLNGGKPTVRYNWFTGGTSADLIDASGTGSTALRYNLFENSGASGNWLSTGAGTVTTNILFNTSYQSAVSSAPNGFSFTNGTFNANSETAYNTMISTAGDNLTYAVCLSLPVLGSTATMSTHDNYLDIIGMNNFTCPGSGSVGVVLTNNATAPLLSEVTGQTLVSP